MLVRKAPSPFTQFAKAISRQAGRPVTFTVATAVIVAWAILGPVFDFSDAWQLTVNTATTIITFLMVFLIQATQNRDAEAIQIKLDEIIRAQKHARNEILDTEEMEEEDLVELRQHYLRLAERARNRHGHHYAANVPDLSEKGGEERAAG
ncbi:MAG TPA: low affinity iron permease family protein [Usitatibacter sp.]|nr:low affinity iron permease family protein [Usitatibacter sp.]